MNDRPKMIFILLGLLMLVALTTSCGVRIQPSLMKIETGPTRNVAIDIPHPVESATDVVLNLKFVAGDLTLSPGGSDTLASGTATFNVADFAPIIESTGSSTTMRTGDMAFENLVRFQDDVINEWDLRLADTPMSLNITTGAYTGRFDLGGLSLEKLAISEGGSDLACIFSTPNHVEMSTFLYNTGASNGELTGLANANFNQMTFNSGAGDYTLSFDGELQRDAAVKIGTGLGTLNIIVPEGVRAELTFDGGLTSINVGSGWVQEGTLYTHAGSGPNISIVLTMGAGTLNLVTH